ncbi:hypothetical protein GRZ59_14935 [Lactobacillus paracasei]|uniref:hypothetical protein n=1 Tax=Lacticaseibacillus paracasei TaxID=1597 RepID=UPI00136E0D40|nr:hypothetical protein [Lacticaseibacillus paracasei]MXI84964.1 hypothetical protein [Lacticaseibacillus paracasei]
MSDETKRDVFEDLLEDLADAYIALDGEGIGHELTNEDKQAYLKDYDNALPDDLPVIPEAVSEYIKNLRKYHRDLVDVFGKVRDLGITRTEPNGALIWIAHNTDTFARAWVLGVWKVEETGEVVKL